MLLLFERQHWLFTVVLTLEYASESPGGLVKLQMAGLHPQIVSRSAVQSQDLHFYPVSH